jgi:hypothetical protein
MLNRLVMDLEELPCVRCGYDMSAIHWAVRCPECGESDWNRPPERWMSLERFNLIIACTPLIWLVLVHLFYAAAVIDLWRTPDRRDVGRMGAGFDVVGVGLVLAALLILPTAPIANGLCILSPVCWVVPRERPIRTSGSMTLGALLCWLVAIVWVRLDPAGAVGWLLGSWLMSP